MTDRNTATNDGPAFAAYQPSTTALAPRPGDRHATTAATPRGEPTPAELRDQLESLRREVARLTAEVRHMQDPRGPVFLAQRTGTNGTFLEVAPDAGGTSLATLANGRAVSNTNDAFLLLLPRQTNVACLAIHSGTNYCYVPISGGLDFYNGTASAQLDAPLVSMGTNNGTANVLAFGTASWTTGGRAFSGASLAFVVGAARKVLQCGTGGNVLWDYCRFHT